jgi:glycosyltransferase involved in cell wall biosynthesis
MKDSVSITLLGHLVPYLKWAEVVHLTAVYSFPIIPTLFACKALGKPLVWSPRGGLRRWMGERRAGQKRLWEFICRIASPERMALHLTSEVEAEDSQKRIPGVRTVVIPNGVKPPQVVVQAPGNGTLRLLYLGRLHPIKGIENLIEACALLREETGFLWKLSAAGGGDPKYADRLRGLARRLGLSEKIRFLGPVGEREKHELFEQADVVVVPSFSESFGLVVAEALGWAVPVIAGRGTPWRGLEEKGCGLWVENDPRSLADAIGRICRMPIREMGRRGREWMLREFSWSSVAGQMVSLYRSLLAAGACPGGTASRRAWGDWS